MTTKEQYQKALSIIRRLKQVEILPRQRFDLQRELDQLDMTIINRAELSLAANEEMKTGYLTTLRLHKISFEFRSKMYIGAWLKAFYRPMPR
jgi:hypothetical protein